MREIKFRGKRLDNGEWVYGFYVVREGTHKIKHYIYTGQTASNETDWCEKYLVDPEMLGQHTGYKDEDGVEVYDGDIWNRDGFIGLIEFKYAHWIITKLPSSNSYQYPSFHSNISTGKIIGNISKNPELLEEQEEEEPCFHCFKIECECSEFDICLDMGAKG